MSVVGIGCNVCGVLFCATFTCVNCSQTATG